MRSLFLLFFLESLSSSLAVNIIEFVENDLEPTSELSSAVLANKPSIKVPKHFILCSSHFQYHFDTKNTHTIYVLYQDENLTIPWFNVGLWLNGVFWVNIKKHDQDLWYNLGTLQSQDFFEWIHICLEIDMVKETIIANINGKSHGVTNVVGINPFIDLAFNIRLGIVHTTKSESKFQFYGKITNIQILLPIVEEIANLTKSLCIERANLSILSWSDMKWKLTGNLFKELETDSNLVCPTSPYADLTIPFTWTKSRAADMCSKLGNGKITTFPTSRLNTLKDDKECSGYWSPYEYSVVDGVVTNENTKLEEELVWWPGFPVNFSDFSTILFSVEKRKFWNIAPNREECLICNTSLKTEYTLRGNCKNSLLVNSNNYKTNTFNKYLGFFGNKVIIW